MARNSRQSKILEIISNSEVETQDELVSALKEAKFDVTQATISRDIKELGLIKVLSDSKKYKYAIVSNSTQSLSNKSMSILKECIISVKNAQNLNVVKVIKGTAGFVSALIDQMNIPQIVGITYGDDSILLISVEVEDAFLVRDKITELLN